MSNDKTARRSINKASLLLIPIGLLVILFLGMFSMFTYTNYTGVYDCESSHNKGGGCTEQQVEGHIAYENYMFTGLFLSVMISFIVIIFYPSKKKNTSTDISQKESTK